MDQSQVRAATSADRAAVGELHTGAWGGSVVVGHDVVYDLTILPTLVAVHAGVVTGALAYHVDGDSLEVVSIVAGRPGGGAGTALLAGAVAEARQRGLRRVWLVTTNDNLAALRFYQRRGMRITGVDAGAVDRARRLKPGIPTVGADGIPLHDELTLELRLDDVPGPDIDRARPGPRRRRPGVTAA